MGPTRSLFVYFRSFQAQILLKKLQKSAGFKLGSSEGKHADHLTTTTALIKKLFMRQKLKLKTISEMNLEWQGREIKSVPFRRNRRHIFPSCYESQAASFASHHLQSAAVMLSNFINFRTGIFHTQVPATRYKFHPTLD